MLGLEGHVVVNGICVFLCHAVVKSFEYASLPKKHLGQRWVAKGSACPTGQTLVAPALARTQGSRHNLGLQPACLGGALMAGWEVVASKVGDAVLQLPPLLKEAGTERQVSTATSRAGVLMLQNTGFENSTVGVKLMFSLFLSLQDNEAKSNKPKCKRSTDLKMCVKFLVRISKIRSRL